MFNKKSYFNESFEANALEKKEVHVSVNGVYTDSKSMFVESHWGLKDFLNSASQRLEISNVDRLFNSDGVEIDDVMMIVDNDVLFVSDGENFISPPPPTKYGAHSRMSSKVDDGGDGGGDRGDGGDNASDRDDGIHDKYAIKSDNLPPVIGNYKVSSFLGRGGFGVVRVGIHHITGEEIALKFVNKSDILSIAAAERTMTEIQCLTTLKHANIILLNEYVETPLHVVLIFELMLGGDLFAHMCSLHVKEKEKALRDLEATITSDDGISRSNSPKDSPRDRDRDPRERETSLKSMTALAEEDAKKVFFQVISAVSYAHNNHICHRDLKLENILLKEKDSVATVKVADFGLSDFYRPGSTRKSNCGTLAFLAPEGFKNTSNAGPPLDVWSLGVILFAMLFGRLPFDGVAEQPLGHHKREGTDKDAYPGERAGAGQGDNDLNIANNTTNNGDRYDLMERDRENIRREEGGRLMYNNKAIAPASSSVGGAGTGGGAGVGGAANRRRVSSTANTAPGTGEEEEVESKPKARKSIRPEQVIRGKIMRCQYNFDTYHSNGNSRGSFNSGSSGSGGATAVPRKYVSLEAKDLIRRILVVDPEERASIPEIFSHVWNRSSADNHHNHSTPRERSDSYKSNRANSMRRGKEAGGRSRCNSDCTSETSEVGGEGWDDSVGVESETMRRSSGQLPSAPPVSSPLVPQTLTRQESLVEADLFRSSRQQQQQQQQHQQEQSQQEQLQDKQQQPQQQQQEEESIPVEDRLEILGSGKLAFGALALSPRLEGIESNNSETSEGQGGLNDKRQEYQEDCLQNEVNEVERRNSSNSEGSGGHHAVDGIAKTTSNGSLSGIVFSTAVDDNDGHGHGGMRGSAGSDALTGSLSPPLTGGGGHDEDNVWSPATQQPQTQSGIVDVLEEAVAGWDRSQSHHISSASVPASPAAQSVPTLNMAHTSVSTSAPNSARIAFAGASTIGGSVEAELKSVAGGRSPTFGESSKGVGASMVTGSDSGKGSNMLMPLRRQPSRAAGFDSDDEDVSSSAHSYSLGASLSKSGYVPDSLTRAISKGAQ